MIPLVQPGISVEKLAMLQGVEYIQFDFEHPEQGRDQLMAALRSLMDDQRGQERALLVLACVALIGLALTGGE